MARRSNPEPTRCPWCDARLRDDEAVFHTAQHRAEEIAILFTETPDDPIGILKAIIEKGRGK